MSKRVNLDRRLHRSSKRPYNVPFGYDWKAASSAYQLEKIEIAFERKYKDVKVKIIWQTDPFYKLGDSYVIMGKGLKSKG